MPECKIKRALISVSDKTGIVEFARRLTALGIEIISTGGTYKALQDSGIAAIYISEITNFPEILGGRVKTLHPAVHGGILARRDDTQHMAALSEQKITPIDLVVVNLYPFREVAGRGAPWEELIENIDIGGPAMIRSAAKNHEDVIILVRPRDYENVLSRLEGQGNCPKEERIRLSIEAFRHTAEYDACICSTLSARQSDKKFPDLLIPFAEKASDLRYGENPGQKAALYRDPAQPSSLVDARQIQGKELSYNNWLDSDSAFRIVQEFHGQQPAVAIIKHTNPCGAALGETLEEAFAKAYEADPVSAYGGIAAFNRPVSGQLAETLSSSFWEVVIAPEYSREALNVLKSKNNLRLLEVPEAAWPIRSALEWKSVEGGFLVQERDTQTSPPESWSVVTEKRPSDAELRNLEFAWKIVKHVKSNAIVLVRDLTTTGVGAGQMNRVGAAGIALAQAGEKARGSVLASDAFFPFGDTVRLAAEHGISAVVQPGGSVHDRDSTDAANELGLAMIHTGIRHFKH